MSAGSPQLTTPRATAAVREKILPNTLIRASAGTGKTFRLSGEFIRRLRYSPPERILATTFTRVAAGEILERILLRLARAALNEKDRLELAQQLGDELSCDDCLQWLTQLVRKLHRVRVGTLDSFFGQLAKAFALELGLPPGWRVVDEVEQTDLQASAIATLLREEQQASIQELLHLLSKGKADARIANGITETITACHAQFLQTPPEAWKRLQPLACLSADELENTLQQLEQCELPRHANFQKARRVDIERARAGDWLNFISSGPAKQIAAGETTYYNREIPADALACYRKLLGRAAAHIVNELIDWNRGAYQLLAGFNRCYQQEMSRQRVISFDGVTRAIADGWNRPALQNIGFRLDAHVDHLLLDEFQDTSILQWEALKPIAEQTANGRETSLFTVGDQKQAIYGWRGGVAALFDHVQETIPDIHPEVLVKSYRSSPAVIEAVNHIFRNLNAFPDPDWAAEGIARWQRRYSDHESARPKLPGYAALETSPDGEGKANDIHYDFVARRTAELHRQTPGASIGVLMRSNDACARIVRELLLMGVEASLEGVSPVCDSCGVEILLSLLQLADHPGDSAAAFHVGHSPLGEHLGLDPNAGPGDRERFAATIRQRLLQEGYVRCLTDWCAVLAPHCDRRGVERLKQLVDLAYSLSDADVLRPAEVAAQLQRHQTRRVRQAPVRVMTIHQSKGLEFDVVVVGDLDSNLRQTPTFVTDSDSPVSPPNLICRYRNGTVQSLLPDYVQAAFRNSETRMIEEQLCNLYVALTRAIHALHILIHPASSGTGKFTRLSQLVWAAVTGCKDMPGGQVSRIRGEADWWQREPRVLRRPGHLEERDNCQTASFLSIALAPSNARAAAHLPSVAPSRKGTSTVRIGSVLTSKHYATERGTLIHAWLQQIRWIEDGLPDEEHLLRLANIACPSATNPERILRDFHQMLERTEVRNLLTRQQYIRPASLPFPQEVVAGLQADQYDLEVLCEAPLHVPLDNQMIHGSIDRLIVFRQQGRPVAADVIDYKTDQVDVDRPGTLADKVDQYRTQLSLYARAVAHRYGLRADCVAARLVMLAAGRVERVPFPERMS